MGLDNGIVLERDGKEISMREIGGSDIYEEVCYWRKYWQFRSEVLEYFESKYCEDGDGKEMVLDIEDLQWFRRQLCDWLKSPELFEAESNGYWTWEDVDAPAILNGEIKNIDIVIKLLEDDKNGEYRVYWYDSY